MVCSSYQQPLVVVIALGTSLLATSCSLSSTPSTNASTPQISPSTQGSEGKASQCLKIAGVTNQAQPAINRAKANKPESILQATKQLEQLSTVLENTQVTDQKLISIKTKYVEMYRAISKSTGDVFLAVKSKNRNDVGKSLQSLQEAMEKDGSIIQDFNKYCSS